VTVSAKIDPSLREELRRLDISPTEVIREALRKEVERKKRDQLERDLTEASEVLRKVSREEWVEAIRESRRAR